jgi:hypothetical protein
MRVNNDISLELIMRISALWASDVVREQGDEPFRS